MNDKQRYVLFGMVGAIALMFLFPHQIRGGYDFILFVRRPIDGGTLLVQLIGVCLVGSILFYAFKEIGIMKHQRNVLFWMAGIIALMFLFPPSRYDFIFDGSRIDVEILILQWIGVCLVGSILLYTFKDIGNSKDGQNKDGEK